MEKKEYQTLYDTEDSYWWYLGLRDLVLPFLDKFMHKRNNLRILDAGCGTGGLLRKLGAYKNYGFDVSEDAIKFCKLHKLNNMIRASTCDIPFKSNSFDFIISLDVLYHREVKNDIEALGELYRVLDKDGILMLNLPAYSFLEGKHDRAIHTKRRYTLGELKQKAERAGFIIEKITYRNTVLFPLEATVRLIQGALLRNDNRQKATSDLVLLPNLINRFLAQILFLENKLMLSGANFPFGLSIFCMARKK